MHDLESILEHCIKNNASDIHLTVGQPITFRIHGILRPFDAAPLSEDDTVAFTKQLANPKQLEEFEQKRNLEFGFTHKTGNRFRVSIFSQKGCHGLAIRLIPSRIRTMEEIGIPAAIKNLLERDHGLILVTGPTGAGKSTTLASMLQFLNENESYHILTIEDPIEYLHPHKKSIFNQREVGTDTPSFSQGLIHSLRQDPDVILVGEIRDRNTIETALIASETGHLVFATLNTFGADRTLDRIIDVFPSEQQPQIRLQLSMNLLAVVSQQLLPRIDQEGRIAVFEVMIVTSAIQNLIREAKTFLIPNEMQMGSRLGMALFENEVAKLIEKGVLSKEYSTVYAPSPLSVS